MYKLASDKYEFTSLQDNLFRNQNFTANICTGVEEKNMKG